jgi:hypothetical protein
MNHEGTKTRGVGIALPRAEPHLLRHLSDLRSQGGFFFVTFVIFVVP